ncbi:MAG: VOC family protein [Ignavibacteriales bacterium]|nr:VOC family protein [Ignavibacteriales bacterium]
MSQKKPEIGSIGWTDLTIVNAEEIGNFYSKVVGWKSQPLSMGTYDDYVMNTPETGSSVAGVCHARGTNVGLPAQWLIYITVANIEESISVCKNLGGKILAEPKYYAEMGKYCVIQDPAGAVCALFEPAE